MEALKLVAMGPWEEGDWSRRGEVWPGGKGQLRRPLWPSPSEMASPGCGVYKSWPAFIETTSCGSELRLWGNTEAFLGIKIH